MTPEAPQGPTPHTSYRCRCCPCPLVRRRSHPHHHYHHHALPRPPAITTTKTNIATTSSTDALTTFHQRPKPCELQFRTQRTCMIRAAGVTAALRPQSDESAFAARRRWLSHLPSPFAWPPGVNKLKFFRVYTKNDETTRIKKYISEVVFTTIQKRSGTEACDEEAHPKSRTIWSRGAPFRIAPLHRWPGPCSRFHQPLHRPGRRCRTLRLHPLSLCSGRIRLQTRGCSKPRGNYCTSEVSQGFWGRAPIQVEYGTCRAMR